MSQTRHAVLISPEARAALIQQGHQAGGSRGINGGLLFGYPLDEQQHLVVSSVRLKPEVGFGQREFALEQTRTSVQLADARRLDPKAGYVGAWFLRRTPNWELSDQEWLQTQTLLEDPDFAFAELVCIVLCFYSGDVNLYAARFDRLQSARGHAPTLTELRLTTERLPSRAKPGPSPSSATKSWYKATDAVARLSQERQRLAQRYSIEPALSPDGEMFFRLSPKLKYQKMSFYVAVGPGFPDKVPHVFLLIAGRPQRISSPLLGSWSSSRWLVELADELIEWLAFSLGTYMRAAQEAFQKNRHNEAADLLRLVLAIEPRTPGAARLLARAEAHLTALPPGPASAGHVSYA
jgi:hypothetical protein